MSRSLCVTATTTLLLGTIAVASPRLTFDDSGFDYRPTDREATAYVDLQRVGEELCFTFSNEPGAADLPSVRVAGVVDLERADVLGSTLQVYTFGDDAGHFRAIFHLQNGHVQVRIAL